MAAWPSSPARIPIRRFIDHGPNSPARFRPSDGQISCQDVSRALQQRRAHSVAKPGDRISVAGLDVRVVASAGETIKAALPGAGAANPYCAGFKPGEQTMPRPRCPVGNLRPGSESFRNDSSGRSHQEQGVRADVPEQPASAASMCSLGLTPRAGHLEPATPRSRPSSARCHHERWHSQGQPARS